MPTLASNVPTEQFIGGKWTGGSQGCFDVLNPSTGDVITSVPRAGSDDLDLALSAAAQSQPEWAAVAPRARGEVLRKAFELMIARREEIAFLMSLEMGKSLTDARGEVTYAAEFFRWFSEEAVRVDGALRTAPSGANKILTFKKPVGVALLLTPWNFPAAMATRKIGPALAAGCSVVLKPAEDTPLTALLLAGLLADAGVPDGVLNVITTDRPSELVEAALGDSRVRKLSFTGSTGIGSLLLGQAAKRIINSSMELGGNAPFIVLDDADVDAAVDGAMVAKMRNGGQACTAANRFLVQEAVAAEFAEKLAARMSALRVGPGTDESTELGPMINAKQRDGMAAKVTSTLAAGAHALTGGAVVDGPGGLRVRVTGAWLAGQ
jgi:succinate-semialdehyde dehydrogenase/glutarate-semialdehyde dehydrogenase